MRETIRRRFTFGGLVVAAVAALLFFNERTVVRAADQYCSDNWTGGKLTCQDMPSNPCTATEGWKCLESKDNACQCTKTGIE